MPRVLKSFLILIVLAILSLSLAISIPFFLKAKKDIIYTVNPNSTAHYVAHDLVKKGVIDSVTFFKIANKVLSLQKKIIMKKGDFEIKNGINYYEICQLLSSSKYHFESITFPEGLTSKQIMNILNNSKVKGDIVTDAPEGMLMPETYNYTSFDTKKSVLERMNNDMDKFLEEAWRGNKNDQIKNRYELLILASIIEKETSVPEELQLVSSVFTNRLRQGMKLQADPTIIYEITNGETNFGRKISKKDIAYGTLYNTYKIKGLPKGPIACPGKMAITAASNPASTDYLYFVAIGDGSGRHKFTSAYSEHIENVSQYWLSRNLRENKEEVIQDSLGTAE